MAEGDTERFVDCWECGKPVDTHEPGNWKAPNDEQWWHEDCYDKVEKAEEIAESIRTLMVPEGEYNGLSDEFHDQLDAAQAALETAVERERLKRDQDLVTDGGSSSGGREHSPFEGFYEVVISERLRTENSAEPHLQCIMPMILISPSGASLATYGVPQSSHFAKIRSLSSRSSILCNIGCLTNRDKSKTCGNPYVWSVDAETDQDEPVPDGGPAACPACGEPPGESYRCQECGRDLVETDSRRRDRGLSHAGATVLAFLLVLAVYAVGSALIYLAGVTG